MTQIPQAIAWTLIHFCWQAVAIAAAYRVAQRRHRTPLQPDTLSRRTLCASADARLSSQSPSPGSCALTQPSHRSPTPLQTFAPPSSVISRVPPRPVLPPSSQPPNASRLPPCFHGSTASGSSASLRFPCAASAAGGISAVCASPRPSKLPPLFAPHSSASLRPSASRAPSRFVSPHAIDSPMTMGTLRAIVLLPLSAITSLGPDELEVVLAHELAHVRRADFFWNILQTIAETLFFFHPAVWWISARIRHERELCCDDLALQDLPQPRRLCARSRSSRRAALPPPASCHGARRPSVPRNSSHAYRTHPW